MHAVRYIAATLSVLVGGYLLLLANGIAMTMRSRAQGWNFPLPSHPVTEIFVYAIFAFTLQLIAAWLLRPAAIPGSADAKPDRFWVSYATRVMICLGGAILAAFILLFVVMALLDAGVI